MQSQQQEVLSLVTFLALGASLCVWTIAAYRLIRGVSTLAYEPRRRVPWQWIDLLIVFCAYAALGIGVVWLVCLTCDLEPATLLAVPYASGPEEGPGPLPATEVAESLKRAHPLVVLVYTSRSVWMLLFCCSIAVVAAPIVEEFLFRLLLQGWLEALERRLRRRIAVLKRLIPGMVPVLLVSLLFAKQHVREPSPLGDVELLALKMVIGTAISLLTLAFAVVLIRLRTGATRLDFGLVPARFLGDVRLGLVTFVAVAAPIYLLQAFLAKRLPGLVPDPITLFFFAVVLGTLYYRTHRIVPSIVLHMALNASSLLMAWYACGQ